MYLMREIKFRAWNIQEEFMHRVVSVGCDKKDKWPTLVYMKNGFIDSVEEPHILMQYTGLKDMNGNEIYEGDVVRFCDFASDITGGHMGDSIITGVVTYDYAMWFINDKYDEPELPLCDAHLNDDEFEVIGNIYENPELLEG
ncbi:YopX family protein [Gracilibacillus dipsosauri]|uniref:YopX family protein n=1 Tax=Gracilibacillus dipsosauri TaxID=178340 RepID=UPI002409DE80